MSLTTWMRREVREWVWWMPCFGCVYARVCFVSECLARLVSGSPIYAGNQSVSGSVRECSATASEKLAFSGLAHALAIPNGWFFESLSCSSSIRIVPPPSGNCSCERVRLPAPIITKLWASSSAQHLRGRVTAVGRKEETPAISAFSPLFH